MLVEDFGDIPIGKIDIEKGTLFKTHIKELPKNWDGMAPIIDNVCVYIYIYIYDICI